MKSTYSIITFLGFICLIIGYFLQATKQQVGGYFQGFGAGLIVCGAALTIHQYMHEWKSKNKETLEKN
jgi:Na+-driven multidrug efflux pump